MARPHRLSIPGMSHHIIQRGNNRGDTFRATADYEVFRYALADACSRFSVAVDGYVMMTNHVHLVLTPATYDGIALTMQAIGRRYVYYVNKEYDRTGGLYDGRYRSPIIDTEDYWFTCLRYIELNPVRAGLVTCPEKYRWSSYRAHAFGAPDPILTAHPAYLGLGTSPETRQQAWRAACAVPLGRSQLHQVREALKRGKTTLSRPVPGSDPGDDA
jgi:putative transposase